ncbi:MAG: MnmC family methyltransferase [Candidatus Eisenbacteria bacterium]
MPRADLGSGHGRQKEEAAAGVASGRLERIARGLNKSPASPLTEHHGELVDVCAHKHTELFTYTYSAQVRAAMLAAGFHVAKGRATGPKAETTIALSPLAATRHGHELLGAEWLSRWQRSDAQAPLGASGDDAWRTAVLEHPQFSNPPED